MALVPMLDLRPSAEVIDIGHLPASIEAEQAFLGVVLYEPAALTELDIDVKPSHFFEPFHGRLFAKALAEIESGLTPEPIALAEQLRRDPAFQELGGVRYLADLIDRCPPAGSIASFAKIIVETYNRRRLAELATEISRLARLPEDDEDGASIDSGKIMEIAEAALIEIQRADPKLSLTSVGDAATQVLIEVDDRSQKVGVNCGLGPLHQVMGLMLPAELYLVAGRPGQGKSALGCSVALRVAAPEWWREQEFSDNIDAFEAGEAAMQKYGLQISSAAGVMELNGEMSKSQIMRRHFADVGYTLYGESFPTFEAIRNKHVDTGQRAMLGTVGDILASWPIVIQKRAGLTVAQLRSIGRRQIAKWKHEGVKPGLMIVDHGGLLRAENPRMTATEAQASIAYGLKELAESLAIPIMVLLQLNREVEAKDDKRPQAHNIKQSGAWEEAADVIVFPYRESYYAEKEPDLKEGTFGSEDNLKWADQDKRRRSKAIEFIPGKVREGKSQTATGWVEIGYNALRSSEPSRKGLL